METILLVDDEAAVLSLCQTILRLGGYNILAAKSGKDALRMVQESAAQVDLALLDVMMPEMNGIELAQHLQKANPGTRVVLMTGFGPSEIARLVSDNSYRIIWKPFKADSLLRMIENALASSNSATA